MRIVAREVCFKVIYASMFDGIDNIVEEVCDENKLNQEEDVKFVNDIVSLWTENKDEVRDIIKKSLINYEYDRVYKIDLALLEMAVTEISYYKDTAKVIVIDEVLNLSKKYSTDKSYRFINGVLKSIYGEDK